MVVLGIESSCDETGVALVDASGTGVPVLLSHALYSQIEMHQAYGGVGANAALRSQLNAVCKPRGIRVHYPELHLCTDNGAMIALAAGMRLQAGLQDLQAAYTFDVKPRWPLDDISRDAAALSNTQPLIV